MTRTLIAAQSGWGKSWLCQQDTESNLGNVDYLVLADYKDEYRGLAKAGLAQWAGIGSTEAKLDADAWRKLLEKNERLVCARAVTPERWREWLATISKAVQQIDGTALVVIDEAHFATPQSTGYPAALESLATTGRGNGVASTWVTQRVQRLDETVVSQADERILGGFSSDRDLSKISSVVPYPAEVHNPLMDSPRGQWDTSLQRFEAESGGLRGSEWIFSDSSGDVRRFDSADLSMQSEHYGGESVRLDRPG